MDLVQSVSIMPIMLFTDSVVLDAGYTSNCGIVKHANFIDISDAVYKSSSINKYKNTL